MKYHFIVNPVSGKGSGKKAVPFIKSYCEKHKIDFNIEETKFSKHATELCQKLTNPANIIVSVGGDGTLNEVINGINLSSAPILGVLPVGSGNDFIKNIGIPKKLEESISLLTSQNSKEIINVDIGEINYFNNEDDNAQYHKFLNNLGIGFDAYVGFINQNNKTLSGLTSYILAVLKALVNFNMVSVELTVNNEFISGEKLMVSFGNGVSSGGGFYLTPNAKVNDNLIDMTVFDKVTRARLLTALPFALINKVEKVKEAKLYKIDKINIKLKNPYYIHCDGEIISEKIISGEIAVMKNKIRTISKR